MMSTQLDLDRDRIAIFCEKWRITEFAIFGSMLRDDFGPDSDVDVLVTFEEGAPWSLWELFTMQDELRFRQHKIKQRTEESQVAKTETAARAQVLQGLGVLILGFFAKVGYSIWPDLFNGCIKSALLPIATSNLAHREIQ